MNTHKYVSQLNGHILQFISSDIEMFHGTQKEKHQKSEINQFICSASIQQYLILRVSCKFFFYYNPRAVKPQKSKINKHILLMSTLNTH